MAPVVGSLRRAPDSAGADGDLGAELLAEGKAEIIDVVQLGERGGGVDGQGGRQVIAGDAQDGQVGEAIDAEDGGLEFALVRLTCFDVDVDVGRRPALRPHHAEYVGVGDDDAGLDREEAAPFAFGFAGHMHVKVDGGRLDLVARIGGDAAWIALGFGIGIRIGILWIGRRIDDRIGIEIDRPGVGLILVRAGEAGLEEDGRRILGEVHRRLRLGIGAAVDQVQGDEQSAANHEEQDEAARTDHQHRDKAAFALLFGGPCRGAVVFIIVAAAAPGRGRRRARVGIVDGLVVIVGRRGKGELAFTAPDLLPAKVVIDRKSGVAFWTSHAKRHGALRSRRLTARNAGEAIVNKDDNRRRCRPQPNFGVIGAAAARRSGPPSVTSLAMRRSVT